MCLICGTKLTQVYKVTFVHQRQSRCKGTMCKENEQNFPPQVSRIKSSQCNWNNHCHNNEQHFSPSTFSLLVNVEASKFENSATTTGFTQWTANIFLIFVNHLCPILIKLKCTYVNILHQYYRKYWHLIWESNIWLVEIKIILKYEIWVFEMNIVPTFFTNIRLQYLVQYCCNMFICLRLA